MILLSDAELNVMDLLWKNGNLNARQISIMLRSKIGWNKNTTYTIIKICVEKGYIERIEPNYLCRAIVTREEVQKKATVNLIEKLYDGSKKNLFASLLTHSNFTKEEIEDLKKILKDLE